MEKKSHVQQEEMRFTFETSFYSLISTSGHILLIYSAGVPRLAPLRPDLAPVRLSTFYWIDQPLCDSLDL